jgi:hypothetical protein
LNQWDQWGRLDSRGREDKEGQEDRDNLVVHIEVEGRMLRNLLGSRDNTTSICRISFFEEQMGSFVFQIHIIAIIKNRTDYILTGST